MSAELTPPFDQAKSEAFAEQMLDVLNSGALSLMLSIGLAGLNAHDRD